MTAKYTASCSENKEMEDILNELQEIRAAMVAETIQYESRLKKIHPNYRESAQNLMHYRVLRQRDMRSLQTRLATLGLSSLGRAESHVLATVDAVVDILHRLTGRTNTQPWHTDRAIDFAQGERLLATHTENLLGAVPTREVRIMVTMPSEAAEDYNLVHSLLEHGMDCMRINCAHDDVSAWTRMIENLRRAEKELGRSCRVAMDLAGPKLRTGPLEQGPAVVKIHPYRDALGQVTAPARIWLTSAVSPQPPPSPADAILPISAAWLSHLHKDRQVKLTDARGAHRFFVIVEVTSSGCWAEATQTTYVLSGTVIHYKHDAKHDDYKGTVGALPLTEIPLSLNQGDILVLTRDLTPGRPATFDDEGKVQTHATIGCTIPAFLNDVKTGEAIWFDDGKIGGVIIKTDETQIHVRITEARLTTEKLRADKGINLPDSTFHLSAITAKDSADLSFIAEHADIVELSFPNSSDDVEALQERLKSMSRQPAIVLKIETRRGFDNLTDMLLTAMQAPCCGIMIARGDLAVECGFERMAEVQEEILWFCEAAHVPVIWATQVLESLAQEGMASRAEITDAAMGRRAECVMLNKGPFIVDAVRALDNILQRMQTHHTKKQSILRELHLAHTLTN